MQITMSFKEFNEKQDTKEIALAELNVCEYNQKRYSLQPIKNKNSLLLVELPPKPKPIEVTKIEVESEEIKKEKKLEWKGRK